MRLRNSFIVILFLLLFIPIANAYWFGPTPPPPSPGPNGTQGPPGPPGPPGNFTFLPGGGLIYNSSDSSLTLDFVLLNGLYNETNLINAVNTTSNIQGLGFNTTAQLSNLFYPLNSNPAGYLTSESDPIFSLWLSNWNYDYNNLTNAPTNLSQFNNDVGFITNSSIPDLWVNITGDSMTGDLNMTNKSIWNVDVLQVHNITGSSPVYINSPVISEQNISASNFYGSFFGDINGQNGTIFGMTIENGTITNMRVIDSALFNTSLLPETNNTWSLGNESHIWKDFYVGNLFATNITSPSLNDVWVNITGDTMTGELNMSDNNITDVETIRAKYYGSRSPITFVDEFGQPIAQISTNSSIGNGTWGFIRAYEIIVDRLQILGLLNYSATEPPDYYFSDEIWINKQNITIGNLSAFKFYFNDSYLGSYLLNYSFGNTTVGYANYSQFTNNSNIFINYSQINNTPNLSIFYLASNPNGFINSSYLDLALLNYYNKTEVDSLIASVNQTTYINITNNITNNIINNITQIFNVTNNITIENNITQIFNVTNNITIENNITNNITNNFTSGIQDIQSLSPYIIVYNGTQTNLSLNESYLNNTINNISKVLPFQYNFQITTSGGSGTYTTPSLDFMITQIIVTPLTSGGNYRFSLTEIDGSVIDRDLTPHVGVWNIQKSYSLFNNVTANITNVAIDKTFNITIKYIKNGIII